MPSFQFQTTLERMWMNRTHRSHMTYVSINISSYDVISHFFKEQTAWINMDKSSIVAYCSHPKRYAEKRATRIVNCRHYRQYVIPISRFLTLHQFFGLLAVVANESCLEDKKH